MSEEFTKGPRNLKGERILPVEEIGIYEWSPGTVEENLPATQVHIMIQLPDFPVQIAVRLKTRERVEWLCATLMKHADGVWPKRT
jgi:hypothetical protein